jgi:Holliday junction resolvase
MYTSLSKQRINNSPVIVFEMVGSGKACQCDVVAVNSATSRYSIFEFKVRERQPVVPSWLKK